MTTPAWTSTRLTRRLGFAGPVLVALILNCWRLSGNGLGNTYYAAAVRSMSRSWRNFFFGAFDPGGFITVDKPPLALWVQTLSAKVFGYSSWSLLLPGALIGVASVALLWVIVHRRFGTLAATVAALALALSPINVAVNRINLPDPFMIFFLLAAVWATVRSLDAHRWGRWLVLAGLCFCAAFDAKMLAAAIPAPAIGLAVVLGSRGPWLHRIKRAAVLAAAALAFALPWMTIVDLTPASARPYVGGSTDNTERDLILGYKGLGRVDGEGQLRGGRGGNRDRGLGDAPQAASTLPGWAPGGLINPPGGNGRGGFAGSNGPGGIFGGGSGTYRLFSDAVGPQTAWLIPAAVLGAIAALWHHRRSRPAVGTIVLWAGWVALHAVVFSYAKGIFHSYYTSALVPGLAALVGIGTAAVTAEVRRHRAWLAFAAVGIVLSSWLAMHLSAQAGSFHAWTRPAVLVATTLAIVSIVVAALGRRGAPHGESGPTGPAAVEGEAGNAVAGARRRAPKRWVVAPLAAGLVAVLVTPAAWAASEAANPSLNATLPQAGPRGGPAGATFGSAAFDANAGLARFLVDHDPGERWDLVTVSAMSAADLIASYDLSVMALGGFLGSDPAATISSVATMVGNGEVRYFLTGGGFGPPGGGRGRSAGRDGPDGPPRAPAGFGGGTATQIMAAVEAVCTPVTITTSNQTPLPSSSQGQVYDCAGKAGALAARD